MPWRDETATRRAGGRRRRCDPRQRRERGSRQGVYRWSPADTWDSVKGMESSHGRPPDRTESQFGFRRPQCPGCTRPGTMETGAKGNERGNEGGDVGVTGETTRSLRGQSTGPTNEYVPDYLSLPKRVRQGRRPYERGIRGRLEWE